MATPRAPQRPSRMAVLAELVREAFWVIALGLIACYAFFVVLGAFSPADVGGVSIAVGVLVALWLVHAWTERHRRAAGRDARLTAARERRGF
jgi:membrane protein implicated in regulation of membrane protease activity